MHAHHAVPAVSKDGSARICNRDFPKFAAYGTGDFAVQSNFQRRGRTPVSESLRNRLRISIHIPRVGDDVHNIFDPLPDFIFQSTSPVWGMTYTANMVYHKVNEFQSTSPVWGMTSRARRSRYKKDISIHIPRVGDDVGGWGLMRSIPEFQSTSPVWGMTWDAVPPLLVRRAFQSTSPVWGMTAGCGTGRTRKTDFNPHPPFGG